MNEKTTRTTLLAVIAVLVCLCVWLSTAVIRLENYHYGSQVGICDEAASSGSSSQLEYNTKRDTCLENTQTRTSPFWNLLYGLNLI